MTWLFGAYLFDRRRLGHRGAGESSGSPGGRWRDCAGLSTCGPVLDLIAMRKATDEYNAIQNTAKQRSR